MLVCLTSASKSLGNKRAFEKVGFGWICRRNAGCRGEHVDSFEDEEAGEGTAKIRHAATELAHDYNRN